MNTPQHQTTSYGRGEPPRLRGVVLIAISFIGYLIGVTYVLKAVNGNDEDGASGLILVAGAVIGFSAGLMFLGARLLRPPAPGSASPSPSRERVAGELDGD